MSDFLGGSSGELLWASVTVLVLMESLRPNVVSTFLASAAAIATSANAAEPRTLAQISGSKALLNQTINFCPSPMMYDLTILLLE